MGVGSLADGADEVEEWLAESTRGDGWVLNGEGDGEHETSEEYGSSPLGIQLQGKRMGLCARSSAKPLGI